MVKITKDEEIIRRGYIECPKIYVPSDGEMSLIDELNRGSVARDYAGVKQMELEEALYDGETFLDAHFRLHNVFRNEFMQDGDKHYVKIEEVSSYELPLFAVDTDNIFCGAVIEDVPASIDKPISFWGINLCGTITEQTPISWVHEITHTQLDSVRGIIKEYYNAEVLSMVMGNIIASQVDSDEHMLRLNDARRAYEMLAMGEALMSIKNGDATKPRDESLQDSQYFVSDIKAYKLFLDYYFGDIRIKKEILRDIQRVFDFEMTLESMLEKYEVTCDIEADKKRLVKYFNR